MKQKVIKLNSIKVYLKEESAKSRTAYIYQYLQNSHRALITKNQIASAREAPAHGSHHHEMVERVLIRRHDGIFGRFARYQHNLAIS